MRIVYILTSLGIGGAERQVLALGDHMRARGHTVTLLVLRPPLPEEWPTRLDVFYLGMRKSPLNLLKSTLRGLRILNDLHPDIVHSHGFHANIFARLFHLFGASPRPISTIHNVYEGGHIRMLAYRLTDSLSQLTTAVSAAAAERFIRLKAVPKEKCIVLHNGIDTEEFSPNLERRKRIRSESVAHDAFLWLAAGRIVPAKDYPNLLRAFALLQSQVTHGCPRSLCRDRGSDIQLWIAGEGPPEQIAALSSLIAELNLEASVHLLGLRRDLPALLDAADAFVLSSAWEGLPLALAEAMSMQKPVVATDVGGTRELIGSAGTLVPHGNPQALAHAMLEVMNQSAEATAAQGSAARQRIVDNFSLDSKAAEWEALYRRLPGGKKRK